MIHQMEVINDAIAFADIVVADISAIKQSDIPGRRNISSSGLSSEAFNHIARNAGTGKSRVTVLTGLESLDPGDDIGIDTSPSLFFIFSMVPIPNLLVRMKKYSPHTQSTNACHMKVSTF